MRQLLTPGKSKSCTKKKQCCEVQYLVSSDIENLAIDLIKIFSEDRIVELVVYIRELNSHYKRKSISNSF